MTLGNRKAAMGQEGIERPAGRLEAKRSPSNYEDAERPGEHQIARRALIGQEATRSQKSTKWPKEHGVATNQDSVY